MAAKEGGYGCGALLVLALIGLLLPVLPYILGGLLLAGLLVLVASGLNGMLREQSRQRLRRIAAAAEHRFAADVCRLDQGHGQLMAISVVPAAAGAAELRLGLELRVLAEAEEPAGDGLRPLVMREQRLELPIPSDQLSALASMGEFGRFLRSRGVSMVGDLAVEARATRAAFQCLSERDWAEASLSRLQDMIGSTRSTLAKARGNELLEPSIPQLEEALRSFEAERDKLQRHRRESDAMLRKLHDFLGVPETIRPILNFDLEALFDPSRLNDLRASYEEVVNLNDSYRSLSRERLI